MKYDALLVVSFGGPEGVADVMPFLENVLRGRNVPRERMLSVAHHYEMFGGVSPINQQNRNLIAALKEELKRDGPDLPIYWGNRNWHPLLPETLRQMSADGVQNALAFVTSAYSSYSSCRQYRQNIADAQTEAGPTPPRVDKLRAFYNHPLFIEANVDHVRAALSRLDQQLRTKAQVVFTAHSIPESMAANCEYAAQLQETGRLIANALEIDRWRVVYQSRSGSPSQPWLGPDILDHLDVRLDPATAGSFMGRPSGRLEMRGWVGFHDGRPPDPLALLQAVDALPPTSFELGVAAWAPTVELTVYVRGLPAPGRLLCAARGQLWRDGWFDEEVEVWDANGRLVAQSRQLAGARRPPGS